MCYVRGCHVSTEGRKCGSFFVDSFMRVEYSLLYRNLVVEVIDFLNWESVRFYHDKKDKGGCHGMLFLLLLKFTMRR